jgi:hypothetical protein
MRGGGVKDRIEELETALITIQAIGSAMFKGTGYTIWKTVWEETLIAGNKYPLEGKGKK